MRRGYRCRVPRRYRYCRRVGSPAVSDAPTASGGAKSAAGTGALALGALGVVFGDIGTSPPYAFREAFEHQDLPVVETNALGVASIAFWALIVIISIMYLALVMRADNRGEGRHPRPHRVGHAEVEERPPVGRVGDARRVRHRAALRRWPHHARHLRAQRR